MQFVCRTCSAVQSVVPERESMCAECGARLLSTVSEQAWYTIGAAGQEGPFEPTQLAGMFDAGDLAWTDDVWRLGLRDWRPARKDDQLVVAVANARGPGTATMRLDALPELLRSQPEDTLIEPLPAGLRSVSAQPTVRPSRSSVVARGFKLATMALLAFVGGGLIVSVAGRVSQRVRPQQLEPQVAGANMVAVMPLPMLPPSSGEIVKRTLPALDEVRAELDRLAPSVRLCASKLDVDLTIAGESGKPRQIELRAPHLTPGMIECAQSALQTLRVAPFTADALPYNHHYAW